MAVESSDTLNEQRQNARYNSSRQVHIRSELDSAIGTLRDISAAGIYLEIPKNIDLNSSFEFDMEPPPELTYGNPGRIHGTAKIVRVDRSKESETVGVAAQIRSYKFLSAA